MIGETISHYRIVKKLGRGGMGVVFEAQDLTLGRRVAIKFLSESPDRPHDAVKRLQREARTLSALNHPNICTIYELGQHETQPYLVEELLVGSTFQELIDTPRLTPEQVLDLAVQVSDGLRAAHAIGLVHRDIKPPNLFLTKDGRVKILDFGLARQNPVAQTGEGLTIDSDLDQQVTQPGRILGTLNYMSPEQVRGEPPTASSDIFAFGIVLYELLHGGHPFRKNSPLATAGAILTDKIESSAMTREMTLSGLRPVLAKMLAKDAKDRFTDGGALFAELQHVKASTQQHAATGSLTSSQQREKPSIAVLPFVNMSADPDNEYFSDGLAEELIGTLARVDGLQVAARTSAFRFRGKEIDIREVGKQLGVRKVLEGSVRKSGNQLRVSVQLLNAEDGYHIWSERYDRNMQDVFAIQEEIAGAVVGQLRVKLGLDDVLKPRAVDLDAYNVYLKGRYFWNRRRPADIRKAIECFHEGLQLDSNFPSLWAGLADCFVIEAIQGSSNPADVLPRAREAADKALAIIPHMAEALTSLACVEAVFDWDWNAADESFQRAIAMNPKYSTAHHWYATHLLLPLGRFAEARENLALAKQMDPLSLPIGVTAGLIAYFERDFETSKAEYRRILEMDASFGLAHYFLAQVFEQEAALEDAVISLKRALELSPDSLEIEAALARCLGLAGQTGQAERMLSELQRKAENHYVSPVLIAQVLLGLGQTDRAIEQLRKAQELRATDLIWLSVRPAFDAVRQDERVKKIAAAMNLPL